MKNKFINKDYLKGLNIKNVFRYLVMGICVFIPFFFVLSTVFIVDRNLAEPTVSAKYFWFYIGMSMIPIATAMAWIVNKKLLYFSFSDIIWGICCLGGLAVIWYHTGTILSTKCISLFLLLCFYFFSRVCNTQQKNFLPVLLLFLVATGLVEAIWGLMQLYGYTLSQHMLFKTTGSFFNPGPYAGFLAVILPVALYGSLNQKHYIWKPQSVSVVLMWFCRISFIAIILILPATMSRTAWLAAFVGCTLVCYGQYGKSFKKYYRSHKMHIMLIFCILSICTVFALGGIYYFKKDSADGRLLMWKISFKSVLNNPGGVGIGRFSQAYGEEQAAYFASGNASEDEELIAGNPEYAFNEYLQLAIEWGVLPFILFIALIVKTVIIGYKNKYWPALGAFLALMVFALGSYPFSVLPFGILFMFLLSAIHSQAKEAKVISHFRYATYGVFFLCTLITGFFLYTRYPVYYAYKKWRVSQMFYNMNNHDIAAKEYKALYPWLNDRIQFLFEYSHILSQTKQFEESNRVLEEATRICCDPMLYNIMGKNFQELKQYDKAEKAFTTAVHLVPNRIYPWYLLTKLYTEMEQDNRAFETARIVLTKEPKVHSQAVDEMRAEANELIYKRHNK